MLPSLFQDWFASKGWTVRPHQLALVEARHSVLLVAPTGGGKTLAGFLPSLIDLAGFSNLAALRPGRSQRSRTSRLHTLYISPLKALAVDVARNLETPIAEMGLGVTVETRTGDTPTARRQRQRHAPPRYSADHNPSNWRCCWPIRRGARLFENLKTVVLDELHALFNSKRGDLLALGLARLSRLAPGHRRIGLSATVADPKPLQRYLMPQPHAGRDAVGAGDRGGRRQAPDRHQRLGLLCPLGGTSGAPCHAGCDGGDP